MGIVSILLTILLGFIGIIYYYLNKFFHAHAHEDIKSEARLGLVQASKTPDVAKSAGIDIIFVHGLGANPKRTWRARTPPQPLPSNSEKDVCWVTDFLPDDLRTAGRDRDRIFFYNYNATWFRDAVRVQLIDIATALLHDLQNVLDTTMQGRRRKLVFIGHSYGGLVLKKAMTEAIDRPRFEEIVNRTKALLFLGTPHHGTNFSWLGLTLALLLRPFGSDMSMLIELKHHSPSLVDLDRRFQSLVTKYLLKVVNFYETKETKIVSALPLIASTVVRKESAWIDGHEGLVQNLPLELNHRNLNKFYERDHNYKNIVGELLRILEPLPYPVHVVFQRKVDSYSVRPDLSDKLERAIMQASGDENDLRPVILHGLGGVGKTQLVLDFIGKHSPFFNPILWIDARSPETIRRDFERCADRMSLKVEAADCDDTDLAKNSAISAVLQFLEEQDVARQWLVILDNADDELNFDLQDVIPRGPCANIIITSQHPHLTQFRPTSCQRISVGMMQPDEARQLLFSRIFQFCGPLSDESVQLADQIAESLGYFPLGLSAAAAYIFEENFGAEFRFTDSLRQDEVKVQDAFRQYLSNLKTHPTEVLTWSNPPPGYPKNTATAWDVTFQTLESKYEGCPIVDLLTLFAMLDSTCIQDEIFRRASGKFAETRKQHQFADPSLATRLDKFIACREDQWDRFFFSKAKNELAKYDLIKPLISQGPDTPQAMTMHGIVRWRAKQRINGSTWRTWLLFFFASCAKDIFERQEDDTRFTSQYVRDLYEAFEDLEPLTETSDFPVLNAWYDIGNLLRSEGQFVAAQAIASNLLIIWRSIYGEDHIRTIQAKLLLASVYDQESTRSPTEAEDLWIDIINSAERTYGRNHIIFIDALSSLAQSYLNRGFFEDAEKMLVKTTLWRKKNLGISDPHTLRSFLSYASALYGLGHKRNAEVFAKIVLEAQSSLFGASDENTACTRLELAYMFLKQKRYTEAMALQQSNLELIRQRLPEDHEDVLDAMDGLAITYRRVNRRDEADELKRQTQAAREAKFERKWKGIFH